jgi:ribokinase
VAVIVVDEAGNNHIVVVPGANGQVNDLDVERWAVPFQAGDIVLMQFEVPLAAVLSVAAIAQEKGGLVILDPAPARLDFPEHLLNLVDILTPNQVEASQLVGFSVTDVSTAVEAAQVLRQRGAKAVIVKLGATGVVVADQKTCWHQPAIAVPVLDTVAAGDAFNGGLAVGWAEGLSLEAAVQWATAVAAYCVTQRGAQAAMATRSQIAPLLAACPPPQPWADRSL